MDGRIDFGFMVFAICAATFCAAIGAATAFRSAWQLRYWLKAKAVLVRYWIVRDSENSQRFYRPVLRFRTVDGREVIAMSPSGWWRRVYPVGRAVDIRYDPQAPRNVEIQSLTNLWGIPLTALVLFAMVAVSSTYFLFRR
jgi:hypothetical protein